MSKTAKIKYTLDQLYKEGNLEVIEEAFDEDYVAHSEGKDFKGHAFLKRFSKQMRKAIPDMAVSKVVFLLETGDLITWERTMKGTHEANLKGIPASGKKVVWTEMVVSRFAEGKIAEEWLVSNLAGQLMLKLGK